jgi:hypothetical protein
MLIGLMEKPQRCLPGMTKDLLCVLGVSALVFSFFKKMGRSKDWPTSNSFSRSCYALTETPPVVLAVPVAAPEPVNAVPVSSKSCCSELYGCCAFDRLPARRGSQLAQQLADPRRGAVVVVFSAWHRMMCAAPRGDVRIRGMIREALLDRGGLLLRCQVSASANPIKADCTPVPWECSETQPRS